MDKLRPGTHATPHEEEHELWRGRYSPKAMYGSWLLAILLTFVVVAVTVLVHEPMARIVAAIVVPVAWLVPGLTLLNRRLSVEYTLTTQRFLHKKGLLRRVANQILLVDIDDVKYEQGLMDRMVNVGTITLYSTDKSDKTLALRGIDDVERITNLIDGARREERRKRAIYLASV
jgi:membrane protein YdbS with pleckstrin-like domain